MIRRAVKEDNDKLMDYLKEEPSFNLFIIGDIENFGYDTEFVKVWIEWDDKNIKGVLLKYDASVIVYSKGEFDVEGFAEIIKSFDCVEMFSGKSGVTERFENIPGLNIGKRRPTYLCELKDGTNLAEADWRVKKASVEDVDRIVKLRDSIIEFGITRNYKEHLIKTFETESGRTYYIEEDDRIISCASTTAENKVSAMIVGVCTHEDYRGKGYATMCMNALCRDLLKEGKTLCLFYDNPNAGRIYKRLGFKDIGIWNLYKK